MSKVVLQSARDYTARMVERVVSLDDIDPHPENPRQHPQSQILQLKASHEQLGQFEPVILWQRPQGYIQVKGHGYDEGVKLTQDKTIKAWILPEDTPPHVVKQIMLASNLHGMNSHDDEAVLARLLQEQQDLGFDLASLGSDEETLRQMMQSIGDEYVDSGEDEIPGINAPDLPYKNQFAVAVMCGSEDEQKTVFEFLTAQGYTCKVLVV